MKLYETTFILSPQADDAAFDRQINAITGIINQNNGKLVHEDRWGVRRLAYPIKKFTQGFYTRLIFEGTRDILNAMDRHFKLEEPYIRHLTVIFEGELDSIKGDRHDQGRRGRPTASKPEPEKKEKPAKAEEESKPKESSEEAKPEAEARAEEAESEKPAEKPAEAVSEEEEKKSE